MDFREWLYAENLEDLTPPEKSVLATAYHILHRSLSSHQTMQRILKKVVDINPKLKKKAFNELVSNMFLRKHPTKKSTTYELTRKGLKAADKHIREDSNNL